MLLDSRGSEDKSRNAIHEAVVKAVSDRQFKKMMFVYSSAFTKQG